MVQTAHAALEAGHEFERKGKDVASLIVLKVKNKHQLEKAAADIEAKGIRIVRFFEPDWDYGFTAFASEPVFDDQRSAFKRYNLWKAKVQP